MPADARGIGSPGAGVSDGCELSDMGAGNHEQYVFLNQIHLGL